MAGAGGNPAAPLASPRSGIISPGFRSVAALAGWDEEAILACLVVQDTPVQEPSTRKKRFRKSKTPTTDSSRKKRARTRGPPSPIPAVVLCLDEGENSNEENQDLPETAKIETKDREKDEIKEQPSSLEVKKESSSASSLPSMDRLKEELSCAICLDICYEPSTTPCGHSFCLNCLKCAASRCGKRCPKCRQLISNGRSCTINTVLWNTIQLLFPQEVEARKKAAEAAASSPTGNGSKRKRNSFPGTGSGGVGDNITSSGGTVATSSTHNPPTTNASTEFWASRGTTRSNNTSAFILSSELVNRAELERARRVSVIGRGHGSSSSTSRPQTGAGGGSLSGSGGTRRLRRREAATPNQSDDLALALRLQREEFLGAIGHGSNRPQQQQPQPQFLGVQLARANLRALAARAVRTSTRNTTSP